MSVASTDRNLLLGLLAFQNNFINREQLLAAFNVWTLDKQRALDQILLEQGALAEGRQGLLNALAAEHLQLHGNDPQRSLAALSSVGSARNDLEQLADADVNASLAHVSIGHRDEDPFATRTASVGAATSSGTRFRILRPHARGGLGQVSVALDEELHREVALKEIQPKLSDHPDSRERFVREAEITGGLEHPGIVPVYGLGTYDDGRPYYAMRFIRGDSLQQALEQFHRTDWSKHEFGAKTLALRKLLGRFIDVCNAIAYAHSRGVLHRDLKPGNIMLGNYGETLVVDWGLAKAREQGDDSATEAPLKPHSSGSGETLQGEQLGTPAYMSPEQAAGRLDQLGPATDVYSLGATLYHVLVGKPPFEGEKVEILRKVERAEFAPPRSVDATIPRPLEAVCLKAMSLKPTERYESPKLLADEIESWLADEAVTAYAEPVSARIGRVGRRHKGAVRASAAALAVVSVVATVAAVSVNSLNDDLIETNQNLAIAEQKARNEADNARIAEHVADQARIEAENAKVRAERQLAANYFAHGLSEYDAGRCRAGVIDLYRAYLMCDPSDPLHQSYRRVLTDRAIARKRSLLVPFPRTSHLDFSRDGTRVLTDCEGGAQVWDALTGVPIGSRLIHEHLSSVNFSPDGTKVLTCGSDETVRIWDSQTGTLVGEPIKHDRAVGAVEAAFSPDGTRVVIGSYLNYRLWNVASEPKALIWSRDDVYHFGFSPKGAHFVTTSGPFMQQAAQLWDAVTGVPLGEPMRHEGDVAQVVFSPDGTVVATRGDDRTVRLWDSTSGTPLGKPMRHEDGVRDVVFSPDGACLLALRSDGIGQLWDAATGAPLGEPMEHDAKIIQITFSPDGTRVATSSGFTTKDHVVQLWDAGTGVPLGQPMRHEDGVKQVIFSPDGTRIATVRGFPLQDVVRLWDASTGNPLGEPIRHGDDVRVVLFSPDGMRLVTGSEDGAARFWDSTTGAALGDPLRHDAPVTYVAFSPDGASIVTGSEDYTARVWDAGEDATTGVPMQHEFSIRCLSLSGDGSRLVTGSTDKTARIWDATTGEPVGEPLEHQSTVDAVAFSPDGLRVVTGTGGARLWDTNTGVRLGEAMLHEHNVDLHNHTITSVEFSPDGTRLVTGSLDGSARLWDGLTGAPIGTPMLHDGVVSGVMIAFSPDGAQVATASKDGTARLWDGMTGEPLGPPMDHEGDEVHTVEFSSDGARLLTGTSDSIRLWDVATGALLGEPMHHGDRLDIVLFSPDGTRIVTGGVDNAARLWDAETFMPLGEPMRHDPSGLMYDAAFSPDSARVVTGSSDRTARMWDAQTGVALGPVMTFNGAPDIVRFTPDGVRLVVAAGETAYLFCVQEPVEPRSEAAYRNWIELLMGAHVNESDRPVDLDEHAFRDRWETLASSEPQFVDAVAQNRIRRRIEFLRTAANESGTWFALEFNLRHLLVHEPENRGVRVRYGATLAELARWAEARSEFGWVLAHPRDSESEDGPMLQHALGLTLLAESNKDEFELYCRKWLEAGRETFTPDAADQLCRLAALTSEPPVQTSDLLRLAETASANEPDNWYYLETLGAVLYRDGQFLLAVEELGRAIELHGEGGSAWMHLFLAMAHRQLGRAEDAQLAYEGAIGVIDNPDVQKPHWQERLRRNLLRKEAEALLQINQPGE